MSETTGQKPTDEEKAEYTRNLEKVNWELPGMEQFDERTTEWIKRTILDGDIVEAICCLGWSLWPTTNHGYYDEWHLRKIADFLEIQNKPFWDSYEKQYENPEESS